MPYETGQAAAAPTRRLDQWLWFARFFKSRSRATKLCTAGKVRVNRLVAGKPHHTLRTGDVLTFPQARRVRVVRVLALGHRRGPAAEAQALFEDLLPPSEQPRESGPRPVADWRAGRAGARARRRISRGG